MTSYDPATVRAMLGEAWTNGAEWALDDGVSTEERSRTTALAVILAAHPAPSTPAPSELHEHCVRMAMEAYDSLHADDPEREERHMRANEMRVRIGLAAGPTERQRFLAAVRDRLAQSALVAAGDAATNKDAAELLSAAEWLDKTGEGWVINSATGGATWHAPYFDKTGTAPSLRSAILAAARSLGWPGGE